MPSTKSRVGEVETRPAALWEVKHLIAAHHHTASFQVIPLDYNQHF